MEPVSAPSAAGAQRKGKQGSLANPEVYENVPGHIIPILEREFDDFDNEAEKYLAGGTPENEFIGFRLKQGVYGQRQADVQMIRTKLPFGGNTVRNVTGDPWAGVCENELFDPTPYLGAYVRYFVRHPTTQLMPRKVKTAFTGSDTDRALTGIHDIAYIARERDGVKGFEIGVGGGTSIMPRVAPTLVDFVTAEDGEYLKWAEAIFRIFDRQDWLRVNRARARIKVLVDKIGIEALREQVDEELRGDWVAERDFSIDHRTFVHDEEANAPAPPVAVGSPNGDVSEFQRFVDANVERQRQAGFSAVQVKV